MGAIAEVEIAVEILQETDMAYLVSDGAVDCWIPKSQVKDYGTSTDGVIDCIFIPEWLAMEKELI